MLWGKDGGFAVVTDLTTTLVNPETLLSQVRASCKPCKPSLSLIQEMTR